MGRGSARLGVPRLQANCPVTIECLAYSRSILPSLVSLLLLWSWLCDTLPPSLAVFRKDASPGPGYFVDPAISRFGRDGTPSYSILGRQKDPSE